jgi:hypothetical protein
MAAPTIPNSEEHFFPIIYEGNGAGQRVGKFVPFTNNGTIANSCIFNDGDSAYLTRTPSSSGSATTFTISAWVKFGALGTSQELFGNSPSGSAASILTVLHYTDNTIYIQGFTNGGSYTMNLQTSRTFEDTSKWYHILIAFDTTQSTSTDRVKMYVDGTLQSMAQTTYPGQNENFGTNQSGIPCTIGRYNYDATRYFDGYMAEVNMVDGTALTPSTFGVTDTSTGRWIPKTLTGITYGTNGFRLKFQDSSSLGDDTSGNTNDFTATNLASTDQTTDSPTQNFATFSPNRIYSTAQPTAEGNLQITGNTGSGYPKMGADKSIPQSGKWYWEQKLTAVGGYQGIANPSHGVIDLNLVDVQNLSNANFQHTKGGMGAMMESGFKFSGLLSTATDFTTGSTSNASGDYMLFAFDMDNGKAWFGHYDASGTSTTWFANDGGTDGNPSTGANPTVTFNSSDHRFLPMAEFFAPGSGYAATYDFNFGSKAFAFTAPTGFSALSQNNFPETDKGVTGLTWIKDRDNASYFHTLVDSSRGVNKEIYSNDTSQQASTNDSVTRFLKGGVAVEDAVNVNNSGDSFVSWNWVCNGGTTETNTDGDTIVTLQKNTTAGFSIGTFTSKVAEQTCGHGLGVKPDFILLKRLDGAQNFMAYHSALSSSDAYYLHLNNTDTTQTGSDFGNDVPTSTVFHTNVTGTAGRSYCFWAWNSVEGYSKFGKYTGNGSTDGPFIYLGFKPAVFIVKNTQTASQWTILDNKRNTFNPVGQTLRLNATNAEYDGLSSTYGSGGDFLSNGFKVRGGNYTDGNASGEVYVYIAFAEHPFVGDGTSPVTAR